MDRAFIVLLFLISASGLLLLAYRDSAAMASLLAIHLGFVMGFFLTMPYGKFAHGLYRVAALLKNSIEKRQKSHLQLGAEGVLGIGLDAGMINKSMNGNFIAPDGTTTLGGGGTDNAIPWTGTSATTYDVGFGLYYTNQKLYVGLSSLHLPAQKINDKSSAGNTYPLSYDFQYQVARHYYVMAGYKFQINNEFDVTPSILTKSDASSTQLDFNVLARWNKMVFVGASYRLTDAIPVMVGLEWKGFKLGYAYDVTLSALKDHSAGTHELMLGYCKKFTKPPVKQGHMNVRFL